MTCDAFSQFPASCTTLSEVRAKVSSEVIDHPMNGAEFHFVELDGLIYKICLSFNCPDELGQKTLVVLYDYRHLIISIVHESPLAS